MTLDNLATLLGPLIGAAGGTYFGLKGAINGMRAKVERIEEVTDATHDVVVRLDELVRSR